MTLSKKHIFDPSILRAYDIRGILDKTLFLSDAFAIGLSFGTIVSKNGGDSVCVGYDGRKSSPLMQDSLVKGLVAAGINVFLIGCVPTPMLYFSVYFLKANAGVMITGSHNPPEYNGFKFMLGHKSFYGEDIQALGKISQDAAYKFGQGNICNYNIQSDYIDRLVDEINLPNKIKVAWDPGNGSGSEIVTKLIKKISGNHIVINGAVDGTFPNHHPDPTIEKNLVQLREVVLKENCDLGIAFDGDADRIGVLDSSGRVVWGDQIIAILAKTVLKKNQGAIVIGDVKCSKVLFDEIRRLGGVPLMWAAGHSLVKDKMQETGALLGGEMSGHIFFADNYYGFDDAIYAGLRLLETIKLENLSVDVMFDSLPKMFNTPEIRFECSEERKFLVVQEVKEKMKNSDAKITDIDGIRVDTNEGWWLLRASNTQSALTARCESNSEKGLRKIQLQLIKAIKGSGISVPSFI